MPISFPGYEPVKITLAGTPNAAGVVTYETLSYQMQDTTFGFFQHYVGFGSVTALVGGPGSTFVFNGNTSGGVYQFGFHLNDPDFGNVYPGPEIIVNFDPLTDSIDLQVPVFLDQARADIGTDSHGDAVINLNAGFYQGSPILGPIVVIGVSAAQLLAMNFVGDGHGGILISPTASIAATVDIATGATFEIGGDTRTNVVFLGGTGLLKLDAPSNLSALSSGFTGTTPDAQHSDVIDLVGINYNSAQFSQSYSTTTGILTVSDGTHSASLTFLNFAGNDANFHFDTDGQGGTLIDTICPRLMALPARRTVRCRSPMAMRRRTSAPTRRRRARATSAISRSTRPALETAAPWLNSNFRWAMTRSWRRRARP